MQNELSKMIAFVRQEVSKLSPDELDKFNKRTEMELDLLVCGEHKMENKNAKT
jgi:hypothetical protein